MCVIVKTIDSNCSRCALADIWGGGGGGGNKGNYPPPPPPPPLYNGTSVFSACNHQNYFIIVPPPPFPNIGSTTDMTITFHSHVQAVPAHCLIPMSLHFLYCLIPMSLYSVSFPCPNYCPCTISHSHVYSAIIKIVCVLKGKL